MGISLISDQTGPFIANIDGDKTNFIIDPDHAGLALPRKMAESKPKLPVENKTVSSITAVLESSEIIVAGVRMNRGYMKPPTQEEITKLGFHKLKDGEEANPKIPEYRILVIDDLNILKKVFPYLTEDEAKKCLPYEVWMLNKEATDSLLQDRGQRSLTNEEAEKIMQYARKNGNNALMEKTGSWYAGYHSANYRECIYVGDWACSRVGGGSLYTWFNGISASVNLNFLYPVHLMPVWSVPKKNKA